MVNMVEIEDRERTYKSWKSYAKALEKELKCLQQFIHDPKILKGCFDCADK